MELDDTNRSRACSERTDLEEAEAGRRKRRDEKSGERVKHTGSEESSEAEDAEQRSGQLELCSCKGAYQRVSGRKEAGRKRKADE